jgi:hypothetical protein
MTKTNRTTRGRCDAIEPTRELRLRREEEEEETDVVLLQSFSSVLFVSMQRYDPTILLLLSLETNRCNISLKINLIAPAVALS